MPSVLDYWLDLIQRRWQLALAVWLAVMVTAVVVLWLLPRQFESSARFLVKNARQELLVGPNERATAVYRDDVPEEIINTELELLRSRDILARVARELALDQGYIDQGIDPARAMELAVLDLGGGLGADALRRTNLIQVTYRHRDPEFAASVLRHLADAYLAAHIDIHSIPGTYELFQRQGEDAGEELLAAERELAALARSANLVLPEEQKRGALDSLSNAELQYAALTAEMHEMTARLRAAELKLREVPQRIQTNVRNVPNQPSVERLNTLLVDLRNRRTELLTKFNPDDRFVLEVDQQIADTTAALADARQLSVDEESTNVNPVWQELESEAMKAQLALAGLANRAEEVRQQLVEHKSRTQEITEAAPRYEALMRNVMQAQVKYELYLKKAEEARIAQALDTERISNVVLAQAPFATSVPSTPNVKLGLVIGATISTVLAAVAVLAAEHFVAISLYFRRRRAAAEAADQPAHAPATVLS